MLLRSIHQSFHVFLIIYKVGDDGDFEKKNQLEIHDSVKNVILIKSGFKN